MASPRHIAHRGNTDGPSSQENSAALFERLHRAGTHFEADVWLRDGEFYLGHDGPDERVTDGWIASVDEVAWWHVKQPAAALELRRRVGTRRVFCHDVDDAAFVSDGTLWAHPNAIVSLVATGTAQTARNSNWVAVMPEKAPDPAAAWAAASRANFICSDYCSQEAWAKSGSAPGEENHENNVDGS